MAETLSGLRLALTTLTVFPARRPATVNRTTAGAVMHWAPAVGLALGLLSAVPVYASRLLVRGGSLFPPASAVLTPEPIALLPALLGIAVLALLSRGLHLDGLADTADGLASYRSAEHALEVMAKPDLGPIGAAVLFFVIGGQIAALAACISWHHGSASLAVAAMTGRLAMALSCTGRTPSAKPDGMGALVAGTVSRRAAAGLSLLVALVAAGLGFLDVHAPSPLREAAFDVGAVIAGCAAAHLLRAHVVRRLGGITGDVLGALNEAATLVALVVLSGLR